jgi:MFS family permease
VNGRVRRLLAGHALASLGMSLPWPLLLLLVWEDTGSAALLGLAGAARMLPYVLFSWAVGRVADHHRRDRIVLATLHARIFLLAAMAVLLSTGHVLAAVGAAAGAVAVATPAYPALAAAMPAAAGRGGAARATTLLVTVEVASFVVGPARGGLLLAPQLRSLVPLLSLTGVATAAALVTGIVLPAPDRAAGDTSYGVLATLRSGPELRGAIGAVALVNAVLAAVAIALLPLAEEAWDGGGTAYGLATGVLGFGALAGPALVRIGRSDPARVATGLVVVAGCLLLTVPSPSLVWAVLPLAVVGAAAVQVESAATGIIQAHAPDRVRASVLGVTDTAMVGAAMVGAFAAPVAVAGVGSRPVLAGAAGLCLVACPVSRWGVRRQSAASPVVVPAQRRNASTAVGRVGNTRSGPIRSSSPEGSRSSARSRLTRASATTMPR